MPSDYILDLILNTVELARVALDYKGQYAIKLAIQNRKALERLDCGYGRSTLSSFSLSLPSYLLASFYTKYDAAHFIINTASLLSVLLPKLPQFHGVRLFGINKY